MQRYESETQHALSMRKRVVVALGLMLAGKGVTIATPFLFKSLVDALPDYAHVLILHLHGRSPPRNTPPWFSPNCHSYDSTANLRLV